MQTMQYNHKNISNISPALVGLKNKFLANGWGFASTHEYITAANELCFRLNTEFRNAFKKEEYCMA